jgi:hypothetical protein
VTDPAARLDPAYAERYARHAVAGDGTVVAVSVVAALLDELDRTRAAGVTVEALDPAAVAASVDLVRWLADLDTARVTRGEATLTQVGNKAREALSRRWST